MENNNQISQSCELNKESISARMNSLERRIVFNPERIVPVKNEYWNFTISYNGFDFRANIPEINYNSAKKLTAEIIQSYIDSWYNWKLYSYEAFISRFLPWKDKDTVPLLQVDNRIWPDILDSTLIDRYKFEEAFWIIPTRRNEIMKAYAIFLNYIISDVEKMYRDCNNYDIQEANLKLTTWN